MIKLTLGKVVGVVTSLIFVGTVGTAIGSAPASAVSPMPLTSKWRACDFTHLKSVPAVGYGRLVAQVAPTGSGSFDATIQMATALPNMHYDVRVIQVPRPSIGCEPGAEGVTTGALQTDANGVASTTIHATVAPGKTGAWIVVERPAQHSQTPAEFYTSEFIAKI